jgi:ABC-2 type transport system ATP-binding protein
VRNLSRFISWGETPIIRRASRNSSKAFRPKTSTRPESGRARLTMLLMSVVFPQEINLDKFLTVEEVLRYHAGYYGVEKGKARERADELLERFGLVRKRKDRVNTLSGGMKRRVMFARALMHDPKVLFLDEPTAGVDIELRYSLWEYIRELNHAGLTILLTTHYLEEAEELCEEIALINDGRIAAQDTSAGLKARYGARNVEEVYLKVMGHVADR